jgi:uncharacterized protein (TIGR02147 family)
MNFMPSIYDYTDYRRFLQDYYAWAKQNKKGFSHRSFLANAGMSGPTYLKRVMEGLHDLTPTSTVKFAKALELVSQDAEYFEALVGFNQATTPAEKDRHFKKLMSLQPARSQATLERTQYDYYQNWYNIAIREMLAFFPYKNNAGEFSRRLTPMVPPGKVKKAVELLQGLGLLTQTNEGLRASKALLKTDPSMESLFLPRFHQSMAKLAVEALDRFPKTERYFSGTTVSISPEIYAVIVDKVRALRRDILEHVQADPSPERVYHLNMQLFPLTSGPRKRGRKKKK